MARKIACLFGLALVAGCAAEKGSVSGTVTFKGERVPTGTVALVWGDKLFQGEIHHGAYKLTAVPPGPYVVTVIRLDPVRPNPYEALNNARKQMNEKKLADARQIDPDLVTDTLKLNALEMKRNLLPMIYASPATSPLRFTMTGRDQVFHIELPSTSR